MNGKATLEDVLKFIATCQDLGYTKIVLRRTGWGEEKWNIRNDSVYVEPNIPESHDDFWYRACKFLGGITCANGHQAFVNNNIPEKFLGTYEGTDIVKQLLIKELYP